MQVRTATLNRLNKPEATHAPTSYDNAVYLVVFLRPIAFSASWSQLGKSKNAAVQLLFYLQAPFYAILWPLVSFAEWRLECGSRRTHRMFRCAALGLGIAELTAGGPRAVQAPPRPGPGARHMLGGMDALQQPEGLDDGACRSPIPASRYLPVL